MLAQVSGTTADQVNAVGYRPPVSPHLAAELAGRPIDPAVIVDAVLAAGQRHQAMIVEGVGGLLVPLAEDYLVRDLAAALSLPVVIAARASLGTINHTLMTLEAARHHALPVAGVVLTPWPDRPEAIHRSNRETIERLGAVEVWGLPTVSRPDPELLGRAAAELPLERWLGLSDRTEV
jgi:dethiobiotin synthetase